MATFNLRCPKNYPRRCNLLETEKENLERAEKYSAFLMYQFSEQDDYLVDTIKEYFHSPTYHIFDAAEEAGLGIKICKICRLAQTSDFGIVILTPENLNVFLEAGMMMGMGKRNLYIASRNILKAQNKTLKDVAFDLSDQLVIEHGDEKELLRKLEKEVPPFIDNVIKGTAYERAQRSYWYNNFKELKEPAKIILRFLLLTPKECAGPFGDLWKQAIAFPQDNVKTDFTDDEITKAGKRLKDLNFMNQNVILHTPFSVWTINSSARPFLEEFLFEE